ncbi:hydantoinase/oxoprolinase family protein [Methanolobus bombayensis]|uniref:hydantoinase/oxoprolinase family protein n=1 Tax=Methanolobus bombayensis TaxID=38023 RepID=UPI001AE45612|nr:hydantoinase/oxoprolinase family protein [Methanolobus bombayensis]MBP1908955.1 N-methylhydantoinase A/oxoprolinase/acetone carboxylase beta subunit [Methanolobus bombayensis]
MNLGLGIDTGGTYTDAVIMDFEDGSIIDSNKSLTTYPDLIKGIINSIEGLKPEYLADVRFTSVSTTLATNTTLEGKGYPAGLILIGYNISRKIPTDHILSIEGRHDADGNEVEPLSDLEDVKEFVKANQHKVSSFALSSYFGVRNPEHELTIKEMIQDLTDLPVVCGHELSMDLGAYERALTALLNAQLIPVIDEFIRSVRSVMRDKNINSVLMMMRCDGSLVKIEEALKKPVESIFSGPAASLLGAAHLTGLRDCLTIDVGGTSTDISMIQNGMPAISGSGAVVGGWDTMVKAIKMNTSAIGGDSHVWMKERTYIGPNRVIPLCLCASEFPSIISKLQNAEKSSRRIMNDIIQPTSFFMSNGAKSHSLHASELEIEEMEIFDAITEEPSSISDIASRTNKHPLIFESTLKRLIQKRYVRQVGFTPTDVLHVTGDYTRWNPTASMLGAAIISEYTSMDLFDLCAKLKEDVSRGIVLNLIAHCADNVEKAGLEKILNGTELMKFTIKDPVVMVGAPVAAYVKDMENVIDADIRVPEYHEVGNAVGALVGNVVYREEVLIRPKAPGSSEYLLFSEKGRYMFDNYQDALDMANSLVNNTVSEYMSGYGLSMDNVTFDLESNNIGSIGTVPLETKIVGVAVGSPRRL